MVEEDGPNSTDGGGKKLGTDRAQDATLTNLGTRQSERANRAIAVWQLEGKVSLFASYSNIWLKPASTTL
jgi:hypothetical protein